MTRPHLTCTCGHSFEYSGIGPVPADVRSLCPICASESGTLVRDPLSGGNSAASERPPLPDLSTLIPGYEILGEINRGGMGVIWKARQLGLNRIVALKVISPNRLSSPEALRRFKREVAAAALLSHENIVTVYHTDLDGPVPFLAMEYVSGIDLSRLVKQAGPLSPADACFYIQQAAHGLQHAYEKGLVHRDIKPANLMVTPNPLDAPTGKTGRLPRVKILDMGLARVVNDEDEDEAEGLTRAGIFLGTPDYVSPEQAEDSKKADTRSDLYSLGSTLYYLLIGEIPFRGASVVQKLRRQLTEPPPSPMARRADVPPTLDAIVRRLMARNPDERFQTPAELLEVLDRVQRGGSVPATPPPPGTPMLSAASAGLTGLSSATHAPLPLATVKAHDGGTRSVVVAPDGKALLTGGPDGMIREWTSARLKETRTFTGDVGSLEQLVLAPNGKWAASCSTRLTVQDMRVQIWDLGDGSEHGRLRGAADNYLCVAISPDGKRVAAGSADKTVWVWSFEPHGPKPMCLKGHTGPVTGVSFARTADSLLTGGLDGTIRQWDLTTGKEKGSLNGTVGPIAALAFGGKRVAAAGKAIAVRQKDGSFQRLDGHDGPVACVAFSADGRFLASGGVDGTVRIWHPDDGRLVATLTGNPKSVWSVAFSPDGVVAYAGGEDGTLRRWPVPIDLGWRNQT